MSALMTRQEVMYEIVRPYTAEVNAALTELQTSEEAEKAWRKCIAKGRKPVYRVTVPGLFDTVGFNAEVVPPEGWKP